MPFIPHTKDDIAAMLKVIGVESINELFNEIPAELKIPELSEIPEGLSEMALQRLMQKRATQDNDCLNFIGAGAYEHHIPAAVWDIASRGEWMTAYTPYQAEASQGTLQLLYEYQTMMANLMMMDVSNASLYDGGSALAEAILMAVRCHPNPKSRRVLLPLTVHPYYRQVVKTIVRAQDVEIVELPYCFETGQTAVKLLEHFSDDAVAALVIPQPNFFGLLEDTDALANWAQSINALVIGVVNPLGMALLKPPGQWGSHGADIACGEGQPLGVPLASGGPYFGFLCCRKMHIRQLPGRLVGRTTDQKGKEGFTLTLQAREQHIRRSKATSNICTNQGLLVTAAVIYMSLLGYEGLRKVAAISHTNTSILREQLLSIQGVSLAFQGPFFHETVLHLPCSVEKVLVKMAEQGIQAGFNVHTAYPELGECLLICATETKSQDDFVTFAHALKTIIHQEVAKC